MWKIKGFVALLCSILLVAPAVQAETLPEVEVWRSPSCGCCGAWIAHMREEGFTVKDHVTQEMHDVKVGLGVPAAYASCHTATVGGYLLEGHVPADDVKRLLAEKPDAGRGLLVPGMPVGSPGMEMPGRSDPYDVLLLKEDGRVSVFEHHPSQH